REFLAQRARGEQRHGRQERERRQRQQDSRHGAQPSVGLEAQLLATRGVGQRRQQGGRGDAERRGMADGSQREQGKAQADQRREAAHAAKSEQYQGQGGQRQHARQRLVQKLQTAPFHDVRTKRRVVQRRGVVADQPEPIGRHQ